MQNSMKRTLLAVAMTALMGAGAAQAAMVSVSSTLMGDPRTANPDNLIIDVTVAFDDTTNVANWTVDIASPLHPNAKLDEFYFSMVGLGTNYTFSNYAPTGWVVTSPATVQGGGNFNPTFLFQAANGVNGGNAIQVTNSVDLTFTMTKTTGNFTLADFLNAPSRCSSDTTLGCGQLGAHLQSLSIPQGSTSITTDSGFLLGVYQEGRPPSEVPIPAAAWLLGSGLMAMGAIGRRRIKGMA